MTARSTDATAEPMPAAAAVRGFCTHDAPAPCTASTASTASGQPCTLDATLACRADRLEYRGVMLAFAAFAAPTAIGLLIAQQLAILITWNALAVVFFLVLEPYLLCRHCPFYAAGGRTLRCHANFGIRKLWRYSPPPITRAERSGLIAGFAAIFGFPFPFLLLTGQQLWAGAAAGGLAAFWVYLLTTHCRRCVNDACILNWAPKAAVEAYRERNRDQDRVRDGKHGR